MTLSTETDQLPADLPLSDEEALQGRAIIESERLWERIQRPLSKQGIALCITQAATLASTLTAIQSLITA